MLVCKVAFLNVVRWYKGYQDCNKANLDILMIELVRQGQISEISSPATHPYTQEWLEEFFELLEKHSTVHKQVSQYTDLMNLSSSFNLMKSPRQP